MQSRFNAFLKDLFDIFYVFIDCMGDTGIIFEDFDKFGIFVVSVGADDSGRDLGLEPFDRVVAVDCNPPTAPLILSCPAYLFFRRASDKDL